MLNSNKKNSLSFHTKKTGEAKSNSLDKKRTQENSMFKRVLVSSLLVGCVALGELFC